MANVNSVFGAEIFGNIQASPYTGKTIPMAFVVGDAVATYKNDFIKVTGESTTINGVSYPVIAQVAATDTISGVIESFYPDPDNLTLLYRPTLTVRIANVNIDPYIKFVIQMNGVPAAADVYQTMDIVVAAGNTTTGLSGMQVDRSSAGDNQQVRILDLYTAQSNAWGAYAKVVAMVNMHTLKTTTAV